VGHIFEFFFLTHLIRRIAGGNEPFILSQLFQSGQQPSAFVDGFSRARGGLPFYIGVVSRSSRQA